MVKWRSVWTAAVLGLAACGPAEDATIEILAPEDGSTHCGTGLELKLKIDNFELIPLSEGETPERGKGHVDLSLNGQPQDMEAGESFVLDLLDGEWQILTYLVHADHTAVDPYAGDFIFVTADSSLCPEP